MKVLVYRKCSTCMKALKWLDEHNINYEERAIKEENPTYEELKEWYTKSGLPLKKFFNTSGMLYKEMGLKLGDIKQLLVMSENEKKGFYKAYIEQIEEKIKELERQERFISLIIAKGLPQIPDENSNVTYKSRIAELRKGCAYEEYRL